MNAGAKLATLIARGGHTLVWGGTNHGTMKVIADAAQNAGGKIIGISMKSGAHKARENADEMIFAKDLSERKRIMLERSDAIVVLAGGLGTLDEATEMLALRRRNDHNKPIVFLTTNDFYRGLQMQLEKMEAEGFLDDGHGDMVEGQIANFANTPEEAMQYIEKHGN